MVLTSGNSGMVKLISLGSSWHILDQCDANVRGWSPAMLSLDLWLDADDVGTLVKNTQGKVSRWIDKSGNRNDAVQSVDNQKPEYDIDDWHANSGPTVKFNGSGQGFILNTTLKSPRQIYIVERGHGYLFSSASQRIIPYIHSNNNNSNKKMYWGSSPGLDGVDMSTWRQQNSEQQSLFSLDQHGSYVIAFSGTVHVLGDGDSGDNSIDRIGLKWNKNKSVPSWTGVISEIIVTSSILVDADREKVEGYLAHKWGLQDDLPSDHPYKESFAP